MNAISNDFPVHIWQTKSTLLNNSAIDSAIACQECGLCCTGAIFTHIKISNKESSLLPQLKTKAKGADIEMILPCYYFQSNSCSVYANRPKRCQTYTCKLLDKLISGELSLTHALNTIDITKKQVQWLISNISQISNTEFNDSLIETSHINLREHLYIVNISLSKKFDNNTPTSMEYEFCLNALDYLKGLSISFHTSSLLSKYNNLILKMNQNKTID